MDTRMGQSELPDLMLVSIKTISDNLYLWSAYCNGRMDASITNEWDRANDSAVKAVEAMRKGEGGMKLASTERMGKGLRWGLLRS